MTLEPAPAMLEDHLQRLLAKENTRENRFIVRHVHRILAENSLLKA
jgi:hypothetical protein